VKVWEELMGDPDMKVVEAKLREAQEHANEVAEKVTTLPSIECMATILAQRQAYVEVERLKDQQKVLQQRLGPRQEETVTIIGELATLQGKVKQSTVETENKLQNLIT
jgi:hypothetical protein